MGLTQKTKRWLSILAIVAVVIVINGAFYWDYRMAPTEKTPWTLFGPDPSSQVKIVWETATPTMTYVRYGIAADQLTLSVTNLTVDRIHSLTLSGLSADSVYYYQVGATLDSLTAASPIYQFRTAPGTDQVPFNFLVISDTQQMGTTNGFIRHIAGTLSKINTHFVTIVGDITGEGYDQRNWDDFFENFAPVTSMTPLVPVVGNHDANLERIVPEPYPRLMHQYFPISVDPFQFFYAFNYSMVHFAVLHAHWTTGFDLTDQQLAWLENDLAAAQSMPFRIVLFHCPLVDSGYFGNYADGIRAKLLPLFQAYHVQLTFSGHDHHYERLLLEDITLITSGGGGAMQDPFVIRSEYSQVMAYGPNYSRVWANTTHLELKTFTLDNRMVDHWIIPAGGSN